MTQRLLQGDSGCPLYIMAHGAGAPMDSPFMNAMAEGLVAQGIRVLRFEFDYMYQRRQTGKKRPPERADKLLACFQRVIDEAAADEPVVIGGKSMGGRMATLLAAERDVAGVAVLGYPFHALGKPDKLRVEHFADLSAPVLICQGERDPMGNALEVAEYDLPAQIRVQWFADGDHDLKPRKASGLTHEQHMQSAIEAVAGFIKECV
ncbi:alpha/beta hydrolase [Reinekea thalattae]|uniref:Alpha/beta hydrolase n=1 Tax=Reinekea thalattae TaxID=2593301 RepID=A0A5C8Z082_9GAMM|nr:alpha/beta hydrolase [Reinekea thalattae]